MQNGLIVQGPVVVASVADTIICISGWDLYDCA
jgi:hypothetical protein